MYRRLPALALALAALLGATAACGRSGDLTGPDSGALTIEGGALYDQADDNGGMTGNGNIAGDASGEGSGGVVAGDAETSGGPSFDSGGMFGNGN